MVTFSLVFLFGLWLALLLRFRALSGASALIALLFGFYLANTPAAAPVSSVVAALAQSLNTIG